MSADVKTYSGIDLLDKIFEFTEMTPDPREWNVATLKSNPPRLIRFKQINALLNAFCAPVTRQTLLDKARSIFSDNNKVTIKAFLQGDLILERTADEYQGLSLMIEAFAVNKYGRKPTGTLDPQQLKFLFKQFVDFKRQIRNLLTFNSGWIEMSFSHYLFSIDLTNSIAANLLGKYDDLDSVLEGLINPKGLIFTAQELISNFSFPADNLNELDMEHM